MHTSQASKTRPATTAQRPGERTHILYPEGPPAHGRLVIRNLDELHPHPSCVKHQLSTSAAQLSAVVAQGENVFSEPLLITRDGIVVDGRARLALARLQGRMTVPCIEYDLSQSEALQKLIRIHHRSIGLNDFSRILLTLDLEPDLKEKARLNQRFGGQNKGSSNLTEALKLDVRNEIARIAGVSVGNVTKVKQLTTTADTNIIKALRENEISIHRAWQWSKLTHAKQDDELWQNQSRKGVRKTVKDLISRHQIRIAPAASMCDLTALLVAVQSGKAEPVRLIAVSAPGRAIFVTEELLRSLESYKESALTCVTSIR